MIPGLSFFCSQKNKLLLDNLKISLIDKFIYEKETGNKFNDFKLMFLSNFIDFYKTDIANYLETDLFKCFNDDIYEILCIVDIRNVRDNMNKDKRLIYQRTGIKRRRKLESQYFYSNPFNRIHGYLLIKMENGSKLPEDQKPLNLCMICTSRYSHLYNIGNYLMCAIKKLVELSKYTSIILEVANSEEYDSEYDSDEVSEEEDESSEDSSSEESFEESSEESFEEEERDLSLSLSLFHEDELLSLDNDYLIDEIVNEFYKKSLRFIGIKQEYNVDRDYINDIVESYINNIIYDYEVINDIKPVNEYGGLNYEKGKQSKIILYNFYKEFGFIEDKKINLEWKCFTKIPFPSMVLYMFV
jgi:hypothetical protein